MIINQKDLLALKPLDPMIEDKRKAHGVSWGLSEAGYDVRIKQDIHFYWNSGYPEIVIEDPTTGTKETIYDTFCLASTIEQFQLPNSLLGIVHDKSTWARTGVAVQNTVIEPNYKGYLTLEITFQRRHDVHIPAGSGIAQILFHEIKTPMSYNGKYQNQEDKPVDAIWEK